MNQPRIQKAEKMGQALQANQTQMTGSLKSGQILEADLRDKHGGLLLRAGMPVSDALIRHLTAKGIREVYLGGDRRSDSSSTHSNILAPYDARIEQQLEHNYQRFSSALADFNESLALGDSTCTDELEEVVGDYLKATLEDTGVVMANCLRLEENRRFSHDEALQRRSIRMSILGTVAATQLKLSENDCLMAGVVGALHDVSLFGKNLSMYDPGYIEHPYQSIDMLYDTFGLTDQMKLIIGQVHEQCDGTGFPRRLKAPRLHVISRVMNVVDAYLTLVEPLDAGNQGYSPSDSLAYLVQHSLYGYFDRDCVRALISAASIYPVGTQVVLDDGSIATVLRSNGSSYLDPIVQLANSPETIIDLGNSDLTIQNPSESNAVYKRLPKSAFSQVLWLPAA